MGQPKVLEKHRIFPLEEMQEILIRAFVKADLSDPSEKMYFLRQFNELFEMAIEVQRSYLELYNLYLRSTLVLTYAGDVATQLAGKPAPTAFH